jgi:ligand-binding sensor domain-containing protein
MMSQQYDFRPLSIKDGVPHSFVYALCEDKRGNVLMGTGGGGLGKYDGLDFELFTVEEGLGSNQIYCLLEDRKGNIWIGTEEGGLNLYDGYKIIDMGKKIGIQSQRIWALYEDRQGNIWIGTYGDGLAKWDGNDLTYFTTKEGMNGNQVVDICEDANGVIWVGTNQRGLNRIEGNQISILGNKASGTYFSASPLLLRKSGEMLTGSGRGLWKIQDTLLIPMPGTSCIQDKEITALFEASDSSLWVGIIGEGLIQIKNGLCEHFNETNGLPNNYIYALLEDSHGQIWIGTEGGGIARFNGAPFPIFTKKEGLSDEFIVDIADDHQGNIWFGIDGGGACRYDGEEMKIFTTEDGVCSNSIGSVCKDLTGNMWLGSFGEGISRFDGSSFKSFHHRDPSKSFYVYNMACDPDNRIWVGLVNGIISIQGEHIQYYSKEEWPWSGHVNDIFVQKDGTIWFASFGDGLIRYQNGEFERCQLDSSDALKKIISIEMDARSNLYVGTEGNGLWIWDGKELRNHTKDHGLFSNTIKSLAIDQKENLWIGYEKGLDKIRLEDDFQIASIKHYNHSNGFIGVEPVENAMHLTADGQLWIGTFNGAHYYQSRGDIPNVVPPSPHLTDVKLFFEPIEKGSYNDSLSPWYHIPQNLSLPHKQNHLTFDFIGIDQSNPESVQYQFWLEGMEESWSPLTFDRNVTYSHIHPGEYTFHLKAFNEEGLSSESLSYNFQIISPI